MECPVCMDSVALRALPCRHRFCAPCLCRWRLATFQNGFTCPLCRAKYCIPEASLPLPETCHVKASLLMRLCSIYVILLLAPAVSWVVLLV